MTNFPRHLAGILALGLLSLSPAHAWALRHGDILVADRMNGLILVDAAGTEQRLFTGYINGHGYTDVTTNAAGDVYALDGPGGTIYRIDSSTGAATFVSGGGTLQSPLTLDIGPDGYLYAVNGGASQGVIRIDAITGQQSMIKPGIIYSFAITSDTLAYVALADSVIQPSFHVCRLDLSTGVTTRAANTAFMNPYAMAATADGNILITEYFAKAVSKVFPEIGAVAPVSSGNSFKTPFGVAAEEDGMILVADNQGEIGCHPAGDPPVCSGALFRVDPITGAQVIVSEQGHFLDIAGVEIYRGPTTPTPTRNASWGQLKANYR
ncbi:MAG: hypothetical protein HOP12_04665 [Candidatus Eisenbacteria bacterium]|uniref:SMP-30/Gluconolactonase/LRE-like region domain-containing protein n=1 Tax=Eiseniibacteriota bacterium TaxID=2212470 RepID=A0A849SG23_UNCEI|nr:hypothetical protein [Candidatus Eisenbacteria bacterium]